MNHSNALIVVQVQGKKPHECSKCDRAFAQKSTLQRFGNNSFLFDSLLLVSRAFLPFYSLTLDLLDALWWAWDNHFISSNLKCIESIETILKDWFAAT